MAANSDREDPASPPEILRLDYVFEALAHQRRRYLLYTLLEDTQLSLRELATKLCAWENDVPMETVKDKEVEQVYISLYHSHVPKLVEDGIIEFEAPTEMVKPGAHAEQVLAVLENAGGSLDSDQEGHARR